MSRLRVVRAACPGCGHEDEHAIFASLNGGRLPLAAKDVALGRFQVVDCPSCGGSIRIAAVCLYVDMGHGLWVIHHPADEVARWRQREVEVQGLFDEEVVGHPSPATAELYAGIRPRLVFGHHRLAEAILCAGQNVDPAALECAKGVAMHDNAGALYEEGPVELVALSVDDGVIRCGVVPLGTDEPVDVLEIPARLLGQVAAQKSEFEAAWPELFSRPFVSTARYLLP